MLTFYLLFYILLYTFNIKNVIQKICLGDYENNKFVMRSWNEKASCNKREYKFKCQTPGKYYFGCQIGNCVEGGNMKILIIVKDNKQNPSKKRKLN